MRVHHRRRYEDVVLATLPVMYAPMQGSMPVEAVRNTPMTNTGGVGYGRGGPFPGAQAAEFSASTGDNDKLSITTHASYHPGDTFSVGGWFNRTALGDGSASPTLFHNGNNDITVYLPLSGGAANKLTLRKAAVADIFAADRTFPSPYTDGWHHCLFTKNGGSGVACYIDGASVSGTYSNQTVSASTTNPTFGLNPGSSGNDFAGLLAHWAVWSRVLTAAEAAGLYRDAFRDGI